MNLSERGRERVVNSPTESHAGNGATSQSQERAAEAGRHKERQEEVTATKTTARYQSWRAKVSFDVLDGAAVGSADPSSTHRARYQQIFLQQDDNCGSPLPRQQRCS